MEDVVQVIIVYTLILGSLYLLIAVGFSIICGVLRIFHLGYAYLFNLTVYLTWMFMKELGLGLLPSILGMIGLQFLISFM